MDGQTAKSNERKLSPKLQKGQLLSKASSIVKIRYGKFWNHCLQNTGFDRGIFKSREKTHMNYPNLYTCIIFFFHIFSIITYGLFRCFFYFRDRSRCFVNTGSKTYLSMFRRSTEPLKKSLFWTFAEFHFH